jgi:hypothetical protein
MTLLASLLLQRIKEFLVSVLTEILQWWLMQVVTYLVDYAAEIRRTPTACPPPKPNGCHRPPWKLTLPMVLSMIPLATESHNHMPFHYSTANMSNRSYLSEGNNPSQTPFRPQREDETIDNLV